MWVPHRVTNTFPCLCNSCSLQNVTHLVRLTMKPCFPMRYYVTPHSLHLISYKFLLSLTDCLDGLCLRVRAFFHKTVRVCHVYCNFKIGCTCRITVIFGTLKDGSLLINTLASNICFSYRNMFQNRWRFVKNSWRLFVKKLKILSSLD